MKRKLTQEIKNYISELYQQGKTQKQICETVGFCEDTIRKVLREQNLIPQYKGRKPAVDEQFKEDYEIKQLIIGSLLGDGSFVSSGGRTKNYYMSIAHGLKQKEYLLFKKKILDKYNLVTSYYESTYEDKRFKNPYYTTVHLKTRLHPYFTEIRMKCYDLTGHKRIKYDFVRDIEALGLAIWYMDDGYVTKNSCILSTCSFTKEEQEILSKILLEKFDLHFTVGSNDNSMYLHSYDFNKFIKIIGSFIIPEMQYKLIPYNKRVQLKSDELLESCNANQQLNQPLTKLGSSTTNS